MFWEKNGFSSEWITVTTFHALGLSIFTDSHNDKPSISDENDLLNIAKLYLEHVLGNDIVSSTLIKFIGYSHKNPQCTLDQIEYWDLIKIRKLESDSA